MSAATTAPRLSLIQSTAAAKAVPSPMGRERPTPKMASMTASAPSTQARWSAFAGSKGSSATPHSLRRRVSSRASGVIFSILPTRNARTFSPFKNSSRAAAMPSPPLLPAPQRAAARHFPGRRGSRSSAAWATPSAARSINSMEGMFRSSMACRSSSRICAAVVSFMAEASLSRDGTIIENPSPVCNLL